MDQFYKSKKWKRVRSKVYRRDDYSCFICGSSGDLNCHHIIPRKYCKNTDLETNPMNLVTVCTCCHKFIHGAKSFHNPFAPNNVSPRWQRFAISYYVSKFLFPNLHGDGEPPNATFEDRVEPCQHGMSAHK